MKLRSYGAVREVTGSMHMVISNNDKILLDCGMFQGKRKESDEKNRDMQINPKEITNVVLSHAHVDHCGRIPILTKNDFPGHVIATRPTVDACNYLLRDCGHIQESDAEYLNYKSVRSHMVQEESSQNNRKFSQREMREIKKRLKKDTHRIDREEVGHLVKEFNLKAVEPLYTVEDAENAEGVPGIPHVINLDGQLGFFQPLELENPKLPEVVAQVALRRAIDVFEQGFGVVSHLLLIPLPSRNLCG